MLREVLESIYLELPDLKTAISQQVFELLFSAYGPQGWWPAESPFEVMIGAVLVQNTNWSNVRKAIDSLNAAGVLSPQGILSLPAESLEELIRPAGYFRIKAKRLRSLIAFFIDAYAADIDQMRSVDMDKLRKQLLGVHGIGPETADSILLYAVEKPALVVDAYAQRVYTRHNWVPHNSSYDQLQSHIASEFPANAASYNEFHALLVEVGKRHCRSAPHCDGCPLQPLLPAEGINLPDTQSG